MHSALSYPTPFHPPACWQSLQLTGVLSGNTPATSVQGKSLQAWRIHPNAPVELLIMGATHGDEPESAWLVQQWMQQWDSITDSVQGVVAIPCLNPDGLVLNTRQNANKVDLNRNFPTANWGQTTDIDEKKLGHPYYGGPYPASEPETQWLIQLLQEHPPKAILSVHTPYKVVNWDGPPKTEQLADALGSATGYPVTHDIGYPTPGSFGSYIGIEGVGMEGTIPVITLELPEEPEAILWKDNHTLPHVCLRWIKDNS